MGNIRVLVTGAGSGVGQGIIKALKLSKLPLTILASDVNPIQCGLYRVDQALIFPKSEEPGSLEKIVKALKDNRIDVLMVGSEYDLKFFAANKSEIEKSSGTLVVVSPLKTVEIAEDKWLTVEFLRGHDLPFAESFIPLNLESAVERAGNWRYPLMLKTRRGTSSRHVHVLKNEKELKSVYDSVPEPMLQKLIALPSRDVKQEYTCSLFKTQDGGILGPFTSRRNLRSGSSWVVEVRPFEELYPMLYKIAENLPSIGTLNVQLMKSDDGVPVPFEFNARFSGTTAIRAHYGFNEPEMALRSYFLKEKLQTPKIGSGVAMRYLEEVFVDDSSLKDLNPASQRGEVHPWF